MNNGHDIIKYMIQYKNDHYNMIKVRDVTQYDTFKGTQQYETILLFLAPLFVHFYFTATEH